MSNDKYSWSSADVEEYYRRCQRYYERFWYSPRTLGLHYGFRSGSQEPREQGQKRAYQELSSSLSPMPHQLILDVGCGVGGVSIWLARENKCKCISINIEKSQLAQTKLNSFRHGVDSAIRPVAMNFFSLGFQQSTFDSVVGVESLSYAYGNTQRVYSGIYRVLKPGGRLVIFDGVRLRTPVNSCEKRWLKNFALGWRLDEVAILDTVLGDLRATGFEILRLEDRSEEIKPDAEDIYRLAALSFIPLALLRSLRLISKVELENLKALRAQKFLLRNRVIGYKLIIAQKPVLSPKKDKEDP